MTYKISWISYSKENLINASRKQWRQYIGQCKGMQIPKSGKFLLVKSRILCFGFRYPAKGNQNHANDCNPEYKFHWQGIPNPESSSMESGIYGVKSRDQDKAWKLFIILWLQKLEIAGN